MISSSPGATTSRATPPPTPTRLLIYSPLPRRPWGGACKGKKCPRKRSSSSTWNGLRSKTDAADYLVRPAASRCMPRLLDLEDHHRAAEVNFVAGLQLDTA